MSLRRLKKALLWALPVIMAFGLVAFKKKNNVAFSLRQVDYIKAEGKIAVETQFVSRYNRPDWWTYATNRSDPVLTFAATIEDSNGKTVPLDGHDSFRISPNDSLYSFNPQIIFYPREAYDLSRGGTLTVQVTLTSHISGEEPYWESEASVTLPSTSMQMP